MRRRAREFCVNDEIAAVMPSSVSNAGGSVIRSVPSAAIPGWLIPALSYLACAFILRAAIFGDPVVHGDEQFYILVADRMLGGQLPYVEIWDRKPVGLFVLYGLIRLIGGQSYMAYQLVASVFAAATALVIQRLASRLASPLSAWIAGASYLALLDIFDCVGGQTPVFYNLAMAAAVLILVRAFERNDDDARLRSAGALSMLLIGVACQIKYTAGLEGMALGIMLLVRARQSQWSAAKTAASGLLWAGIAAMPTLIAFAVYVALGHGQAFLFANFQSILLRQTFADAAWSELAKTLLILSPFFLAVLVALRRPGLRGLAMQGINAHSLIFWWFVAALLSYFAFGTWYNHYIAPVLVPLVVLAAAALDTPGNAKALWFGLLAGLPMVAAPLVVRANISIRGDRAQVERLRQAIVPELKGGCLYVFEGASILYDITHSCLPTRYPFPPHLDELEEANAIGVDQRAEVARILRSRPTVIAMMASPFPSHPNLETRAIVTAELARNYELYAQEPIGKQRYMLYRLRT